MISLTFGCGGQTCQANRTFRVYASTASGLAGLRFDALEPLDTVEFRSVLDYWAGRKRAACRAMSTSRPPTSK